MTRTCLLTTFIVFFVFSVAARVRNGHRSGHHHNLLQRALQKPRPKTVQPYHLWKPQEIKDALVEWAEHYSDFIHVTTSQEAFGLPAAGGPNDCTFDEGDGCRNYFFVIQDFVSHPEGSISAKRLPEVLWSGELHGDEQVGPTAVLEAATLLLSAASCEALPRSVRPTNGDVELEQAWEKELALAQSCRQGLLDYGIDDEHRKWLARLVSTRRIVVVPTANALGYYNNQREEGRTDPNRDFPYDQMDPEQCMVTIAGRTLNEIFRQHLFQLSLTFHGGMEVIGYEWGAPTYEKRFSPDHVGQQDVGAAYSRFGGSFAKSPNYQYGPMNDLVYPVNGGMEDWAYAGSWDPARVVQCDPKTFGGYPKEKTIYSNSTLRVFNMLVETSDDKIPKSNLGSSLGVLTSDSPENGHVSRNIRLALLAAELVEPYLVFRTVNGLALSDDIIPSWDLSQPTSCQTTSGVKTSSSNVTLEWTVGGALEVDDTQLWYAKWTDVQHLDCWTQPDASEDSFHVLTPVKGSKGSGLFSEHGATVFSAEIDLSQFSKDDRIVVLAMATVDQHWTSQPDNVAPPVPPQSHIVNARTNLDWYHEIETSVIQGRLKWFSRPLTIQIDDPVARSPGGSDAVELAPRFTTNPSPTTEPIKKEHTGLWFFGMFVVVVLSIVGLVMGTNALRHHFRGRSHLPRNRQNDVRNGRSYSYKGVDYEGDLELS